jgi:murein DD-endopeptidase MepM/ murein hydrolase activator NlpD
MKTNNSKILWFVRRNALYLILAACILAVGLSVTLMIINQSKSSVEVENPPVIEQPVDKPDTPSDPVDKPDQTPTTPVDKPIVFDMPVKDVTSIGEYSETMVFNSTLGRFSAHKAIDFFANEGTEVYAVYDGTIVDVKSTLLQGSTITIDHGNGLKTVYNSLLDGDEVSVGKQVNKGDLIGQVSSTNRQESLEGAHLHFEVIENGENIDPAKYLIIDEK